MKPKTPFRNLKIGKYGKRPAAPRPPMNVPRRSERPRSRRIPR
jgi:hypothetical protein